MIFKILILIEIVSFKSFSFSGTTALFISSKYEEIYPPDVHEFVYITDNAYDKFDILNMEAQILKVIIMKLDYFVNF